MTTPQLSHQAGISLVDLLVGMAIGLMAVLVISQLFIISEEQRRTPTSAANTHINGMLAMKALQRDVRQAGYGIANDALLACRIAESAQSLSIGLAGVSISPLVIQAGAFAADSDSLRVLSSNATDAVIPIYTQTDHAATSVVFEIPASPPSPQAGDWMLLASASGSTCHAFQVSRITHTDTTSALEHSMAAGLGLIPAGSVMVNLGSAPTYRTWSISDLQQLQATDHTKADQSIDAFSDVVFMRALYAKDTSGSGRINRYDTITPNSPEQWAQVLGVRLAIVARNTQRSKEPITTAPLQWDLGHVSAPNSAPCSHDTSSQCLSLDLSATHADWSDFRYQLFDTLVPLRNLLWS